ncbi:hypothetical protein H257_09482 [Aphanomyces astaci]|uniref:Uncharacterized protein n=1 Tax=Aphanomyces astaci TaxID=112090 RepID=W4GBX3_APHAT|nr:hypothetical protein H257_09482 [Aphanomyces astaci]ETV76463.1 hypothetical protein H257_09482 [Aphanomyces astaci]|eukprot:XP_009834008.1 hypothetical protein H257_09482 [Aphanomyces astaci]
MSLVVSDVARLPLPDVFHCSVSVKFGRALGKSRTSVGEAVLFSMRPIDTFNIMTATVLDIVDNMVATQHSTPNRDKLQWGPHVPFDVYTKVAINAPQSKYVRLSVDNFNDTIARIWDNAGKTRLGQAAFVLQLFVYIEKHVEIGIRRAT